MKQLRIIFLLLILIVIIVGIIGICKKEEKAEKNDVKNLIATVTNVEGKNVTVQDSNNVIYTFKIDKKAPKIGQLVNIEYKGKLNTKNTIQTTRVITYKTKKVIKDEDGLPEDFKDEGIFSDYYILAYKKLQDMTLDEKIAQILLVRYPEENQAEVLKENKFGGYIFFAKDFKGKNKDEVIAMISNLQSVADIPILTAVDEEGGIVTRVSSNTNLRSEKFKSPRELYLEGGFDRIKEDTKEKSDLLESLGLNLNLAPVVDVSTNPDDYMYSRTLGENTDLTSRYAKTVIEESKNGNVSFTLKHFPGYGNNADTHDGTATDKRTYEEIMTNDIPPFEEGIKSGAEAVLVSHNIVSSIDENNPASLSKDIHNLLRDNLKFTGIVITDDIAMGALENVENKTVKALLAGNDLIITTDYQESINEIKNALEEKTIDENLINKRAFRILAWKYYKGMMFQNK